MTGQPGADARAGAGDDRDTASKGFPCGHRVRRLPRRLGVLFCEQYESSASKTTVQRGEDQSVSAPADAGVDHTARHGKGHRVADLIDVQVEPRLRDVSLSAGAEDVGGVVA